MTRTERRAEERRQRKLEKKTRRAGLMRAGRVWVVAGSFAAYAVMGPGQRAFAATTVNGSPDTGDTVATLPLKRFNIPAGPLDAAITTFEQDSGLAVRVDLEPGVLSGFKTEGVRGLYRQTEALRLLLEGTGLLGTIEPGTTAGAPSIVVIGLRRGGTLKVTVKSAGSVAMDKFTQPLVDTPQTVEVVPRFVLQDEQNRTLMDAVRNVPGISLAAGESGAQGDSFTIRGFTARNDIYLDGIRDFGSYYRDSFDFNQVDVLEGPAGVEFGRGSTGGVINQESKVPLPRKFVHVETQFGTDLTRRVTVDINEPLPEVAEGTAFRLNAMADEGGVAGRPYAENRRFGLAPSVSFGLGSPTQLTVSYFHLTESDTPDYGLPWLMSQLVPGVNRHSYFGFPEENHLKTNDDVLTLKANHQFNDGVDLHTIARWANYPRDVQITEPQLCGNVKVSTPVGGWVPALPADAVNSALPCAYDLTTPPASMTVNRNQIQIKSVEGNLWDQTEATARFKVAGVQNDLVGGVEGGQEVSNPVKYSHTVNKINTVTPTNLVTPNPDDAFSGTGYISSITHTKSDSVGIYFVDTLKLGRRFDLSGGVRWDYFDTRFNLYAPVPNLNGIVIVGAAPMASVPPISQIVDQPSYRAAFVYKPNSHGSIYFDYGTSFNPSAESLSLSVSSSVLPPEENQSYEVGAKYNLLNNRLRLDGAWFRTEQDNARETDPTNSNNIVESGNQVVKGMQASAVGELGGGLNFVLGYAYLDSAVIASQFYPTSVGFPLRDVPRQTFNAFVAHNLPLGFNFGLGGNYVGSRTASSTTPYVPTSYGPATAFAVGSAPCGVTATVCYQVTSVAMKQVAGYWVFNAMLRRRITSRIELQANVYNLLNRFYIDQPHPSHLIPGAGRSALIGAKFRF